MGPFSSIIGLIGQRLGLISYLFGPFSYMRHMLSHHRPAYDLDVRLRQIQQRHQALKGFMTLPAIEKYQKDNHPLTATLEGMKRELEG